MFGITCCEGYSMLYMDVMHDKCVAIEMDMEYMMSDVFNVCCE